MRRDRDTRDASQGRRSHQIPRLPGPQSWTSSPRTARNPCLLSSLPGWGSRLWQLNLVKVPPNFPSSSKNCGPSILWADIRKPLDWMWTGRQGQEPPPNTGHTPLREQGKVGHYSKSLEQGLGAESREKRHSLLQVLRHWGDSDPTDDSSPVFCETACATSKNTAPEDKVHLARTEDHSCCPHPLPE